MWLIGVIDLIKGVIRILIKLILINFFFSLIDLLFFKLFLFLFCINFIMISIIEDIKYNINVIIIIFFIIVDIEL